MNFAWQILDIEATNGLITQAKYLVTVKNDKTEVSTEGWWHFKDPKLVIPFVDVTEENVISWIEAEAAQPTNCLMYDGTTRIDSTHKITARLEEQLQVLTERANNKVVMPWLPQVFTPEI
jgi:hypothetical protein